MADGEADEGKWAQLMLTRATSCPERPRAARSALALENIGATPVQQSKTAFAQTAAQARRANE